MQTHKNTGDGRPERRILSTNGVDGAVGPVGPVGPVSRAAARMLRQIVGHIPTMNSIHNNL